MKAFALAVFLFFGFNLSQAKARSLRPFATDGCTASFANSNKDWTECCVAHDFAYWIGGTQAQKAQADERMLSCLVGEGALRTVAQKIWNSKIAKAESQQHWGTGWDERHPDSELTDDDWKEVRKYEDLFRLRLPLTRDTTEKMCDSRVVAVLEKGSMLDSLGSLTCFQLVKRAMEVDEWIVYSPECKGFYITTSYRTLKKPPSIVGYGDCQTTNLDLTVKVNLPKPLCPFTQSNLLSIYKVHTLLLSATVH